MKANELRIGNYVYAKTIEYHKDGICMENTGCLYLILHDTMERIKIL